MLGQLRPDVFGIDRRHHAVEPVDAEQVAIGQQHTGDRAGVGEPGGLQHDTGDVGNAAVENVLVQLQQRRREIALYLAAHAARRQQHGGVVDRLSNRADQRVIEPDLAEFVDYDGGSGHRWCAERRLQQRGLTAAEEAGQYGQRNGKLHGALALGLQIVSLA